MCVIIFDNRVNDAHLQREVLERAQIANPDGMGLMYAHDDTLEVWHSLDDLDEMWKRYVEVRKQQIPIALHFRWSTAGDSKSLENCHPFVISPNFAFMHNGTLKQFEKVLPAGVSDSKAVADGVFAKLPGDFLNQPMLLAMVTHMADGDRFLFMDGKGRHSIIDAMNRGFWWQGCWFSRQEQRDWLTNGILHTYDYGGWTEKVLASGVKRQPYSIKGSYSTPLFDTCDKPVVTTSKKSAKSNTSLVVGKTGAPDFTLASDSLIKDLDKTCLFFDYSNLIPPDNDTFMAIDTAYLTGAQLWEVAIKGDKQVRYMPGAMHDPNCRVFGTVYAMVAPRAWHDLSSFEELCDPKRPYTVPFRREIRRVTLQGTGEVSAWVYMATNNGNVTRIAPVPFGDWSRYQTNIDNGTLDTLRKEEKATKKSKKKRGPRRGDTCPACHQSNTTVYEIVTGLHAGLTILHCRACEHDEEFHPEQTTQADI